MHAIPLHILRMVFSLRSHLRQLAGVQLCTGLWMQMHHTNGQRQQRKLLPNILSIRGDEAAGFEVFVAVEAAALALEVVEELVQAFAPVFRAEYQQEVVAANMADEVAGRVDVVVQQNCLFVTVVRVQFQ